MTLLAEVEIRHSRPVAPTRRVALGARLLPWDPAPGWGAVLLGGLVTVHLGMIDPEMVEGVHELVDDLEAGATITQPRLRHRFQHDTVGLDRSRHSLLGEGEHIWFDFDDHGRPEPNLLGALYATAAVPKDSRRQVFRVIRKALAWDRPLDASFVAHMLGDDAAYSRWRALPEDHRWALRLLGFGPDHHPGREAIVTAFRDAVWQAHPDRGGDAHGAGLRMVELTRARRILLG